MLAILLAALLQRKPKNEAILKSIFYLVALIAISSSSLNAYLCPVAGIEAAVAISSHAGKSKFFPNDTHLD